MTSIDDRRIKEVARDLVNCFNAIEKIKKEGILEESYIKKKINKHVSLLELDSEYDEDVLETIKNIAIDIICENAKVKMKTGISLCDKREFKPWYSQEKKNIDNDYWDRYSWYLSNKKNFSNNVIDSIYQNTDEIVGLLGNPKQKEAFNRRGLVIGDVQSGKTATYIGVINKAADAGYKTIILLTGTIEKLRRQTQERIDEGFVGRRSDWANWNKIEHVGVGKAELCGDFFPTTYTDTINDFRKKSGGTSVNLDNISDPAIFVLKKNKHVLDSLNKWLRSCSIGDKFESPLLLIDDEADNASINTNSEDDDPTTINKSIREILSKFKKSSYLAFTATPFANIFIDPDNEEELLKDDLFPKDFIYVLESPSNYIGASSIFKDDGKNNFMLKKNDDCESYIPLKHKKDCEPGEMPKSLEEAIISFIISCTIRDLRGYEDDNMTMLVNISRFIDVQEKIKKQIYEYLRVVQKELESYSKVKNAESKYEKIKEVKKVYEKHFKDIDNESNIVSWENVLDRISKSSAGVQVVEVNGSNPGNLKYDSENGIRVIAVGGLSLSRGLTLEGLSTSYFYRNSKMYDTLMQMGRWFGYRHNYDDLCQIWMPSESIEWYGYISEATDDLKNQVQRMRDYGGTPKDFGLIVRDDKDALLVTAINKMRTAAEYTRQTQLSGTLIETPHFFVDNKINENNIRRTNTFVKDLIQDGYYLEDSKGKMALNKNMFLNVPQEKILDYLSDYYCNIKNYNFDTEILVKYFREKESEMKNWDVLIASGEGENIDLGGLDIKRVSRSFSLDSRAKTAKEISSISCSRNRLGNIGDATGGLTKDKTKEIESKIKERHLSSRDYFNYGVDRNPLLVIYPVEFKYGSGEDSDIKKEIVDGMGNYVIGLAIGVPYISGEKKVCIKYKMNKVKQKEIFGTSTEEEFVEEI